MIVDFMSLGLIVVCHRCDIPVFYCHMPIAGLSYVPLVVHRGSFRLGHHTNARMRSAVVVLYGYHFVRVAGDLAFE